MSTLTIQVSEKVLGDIVAEAKRRGITKRRVIQERLQKPAEPSLWDRTKNLVVDSDKLPADLARNKKKYLEGYGGHRSRGSLCA
jgi:hypothetical protein